ncbi:hypothetical protein ACU686_16350 [Yinghuangia aomiensis]
MGPDTGISESEVSRTYAGLDEPLTAFRSRCESGNGSFSEVGGSCPRDRHAPGSDPDIINLGRTAHPKSGKPDFASVDTRGWYHREAQL